MEKCSINYENGETEDIIKYDPISIEQNNIKYDLNIEIYEDNITLLINDKQQFPSVDYNRTMNLKEIKNLNKIFSEFKSLFNFYEYLKKLSADKKLIIKKNNNNNISIILSLDQNLEIHLFPKTKDIEMNIKEICKEILDMKEKIKEIDVVKKENKELKIKIEEQNNEIIFLKNSLNYILNKSIIIKEDEKKIIFSEIEKKINKKIKKIKKIYQATIDGGDPINFHNKCDNISNTLVLIKSEGQRRFGGFTPIPWISEEKGIFIKDNKKKTFLFSLDNKKIYQLKNVNYAVYHCKNSGPCFGFGRDIAIDGNPINGFNLYTNQNSYDYQGNNHSLSEYNGHSQLKALEYEVFQIIFY